MSWHTTLIGDARTVLRGLSDGIVHCVVTSPPYWGLRDYGVEGQLGLEAAPQQYIDAMVEVFREVRRVLRSDGTLWLNIADSYAGSGRGRNGDGTAAAAPGSKQATNRGSVEGVIKTTRPSFRRDRASVTPVGDKHDAQVEGGALGRYWTPAPEGLKPKDLVGIPWRLALALQADGWWLRSDIIWAKPNPMPEPVLDRPTKSHEYLFLLTKSERYYYDAAAIAEEAEGPLLKKPDGWNSGGGAHGAFHPNGREKGAAVDEVVTTKNKRDVWMIPTEGFPDAHFATFPQKLVEPCIMAGTPEGGVCSFCGAPSKRVTKAEHSNPGGRTTNGPRSKARKHIDHGTAGFDQRLEKTTRTLGWTKSCDCGAGVKPATVLDPFMGSGTVGLVAIKARRDSIGIELNPKYAAIAEARIAPELAQGRLV